MTTGSDPQVTVVGGIAVGGTWGDPSDEDGNDDGPSGQEASA